MTYSWFLYLLLFLYHDSGSPNFFDLGTAKELTGVMLHDCESDLNLWTHKKN
jgi:hypothetical protein